MCAGYFGEDLSQRSRRLPLFPAISASAQCHFLSASAMAKAKASSLPGLAAIMPLQMLSNSMAILLPSILAGRLQSVFS